MHMVFLLGAGDHFCVAKVLLQKENTILTDGVFFFGAGDEARTRYLDLGKVALYQMSYARKRRRYCGTLVPPVGVEPTTRGFSVRCSTN